MALVFGVLAGFLGSKGQQASVKESLDNSINTSAISNVLIENKSITTVSTFSNQVIKIILNNCSTTSLDLSQTFTGNLNILSGINTQLNTSIISDLQSKIQEQLESAISQENSKLIAALGGSQSSNLTQDIKNALKSTINSTITIATVQKIYASTWNNEKISLTCINSTIPAIKMNQTIVVDMTIQNLIGQVLTNFMTNSTVANWVSSESGKVTQKETGISSTILAIIILSIIFVILLMIGIGLYFALKKDDSSQ